MSITTTGLMKQQLMAEPTDLAVSSPMEGGVNRPSMAGDLASAMHDVDFRNLMEQYSAMAGTSTNTPMTNKFMQEEKQRVDDEDGKPSWTKALEPLTSSGHSLITKTDTPLNNIVNNVSNFFMSFSSAQASEGE